MEQVTLWCQFLNLPVGVVKVLEALYTRVICSDCKNNTQCGFTSRTRAIVWQETPLLQTKDSYTMCIDIWRGRGKGFWGRLGYIELQHIHPREYLACSFVKLLYNTINFISNKPITLGHINWHEFCFSFLVQSTWIKTIYPHVIFTARRSHTLYIEVDETVSGCFDLSPSFNLIGSQALLTGQTALFIG